MNTPVYVLFIEDNPGDARLVREQLSLNGQASATRLIWVDRLASGLDYLPAGQVDAVLLDLSLPDSHGLDTLQRVLEAAPGIPVIVMTGSTDENLALQAVQAGAQDYLIKGQVDGGLLTRAIRYAIERKRLELQMRELAAIVEHSDDVIFRKDLDGTIRSWNRGAEQLYGYRPEEVIGRPVSILIPPEHLDLMDQIMSRIRQGEKVQYIETERIRKNGDHVTVSLKISPIRDGRENIIAASVLARDITEKKRADEAVQQMRDRFQALTEHAPDGVALIDMHQRMQFVSPAGRQMFGYSQQEQIEINPAEHTHPEDLPEVISALSRLIEDPAYTPTLQYRFRHKDGSWRWIESTFTNLLEVKSVEAIVINFRDITERKQDVKLLLEQKALLDKSQEIAHVGSWELDLAFDRLIWSDEVYRIFGMHPQEFDATYQAFLEAVHPDDREAVDSAYSGSLQAGAEGYQIEHRIIRRDTAEVRTVLEKCEHLRDETGRVIRSVGIVQDITERKQAERALRRSEQRFRALIENNAEAIALLGKDGTILFESPAATRILGFEIDEMIGRNALELMHPEDRPAADALMGSLAETPGAVVSAELRYRRKDGAFCWVEATGSNLLEEPSVQAIVVNYRDVSGRKSLEHEIRERMKELTCLYRVQQDLPEDMPLDELCERTMTHLIQGMQFPDQAAVRINLNGKQYASARYSPALVQVLTAGIHLDDQPVGSLSVYYTSDSISSLPEEASMVESIARSIGKWLTQEQAQVALRKSEQQYRSLFEDSPVSLWLEDFSAVKERLGILKQMGVADIPAYLRDHRELVWEYASLVKILDVNSAAMKVYHAQHKEDLLGSLVDVFPDFALDHFISELDLIAGGRLNFEWEQIDHTLTGNQIYVNMRWSVAPGYEDSLSQVLVSTVDITERKQAEQRNQRQIQRLNILRKIDQGITGSAGMGAVLDIILRDGLNELGADAGVVLLYDPEEQLLKYEQGIGMRTTALQHTQLNPGQGYAGQAALSRQTVIIPSLLKHNTEFLDSPSFSQEGFACYFGVPLIVKDEIKGVLEIFHRAPLQPEQEWLDFMETLAGQTAIAIDNAQLWQRIQRQNLELEQRVAKRTAELEHANRAKDEFLATMSHELRTPLNSILGLSESLLEQRRDPLSEHQQASLRIIESSGRHLLDLINDILDLSKIEAGKLDYYPQVVDLFTLCRASLAFVKEQAVRKSISMVYAETNDGIRIHADPRRLKQALVNLLTNAVKFTPENGQVTFEVYPEPEEDRIRFSVTDTGIGIAEKDLKQLFQPFVQVDSSLNRHYEGTGLGLVLVERLTDLHGGSVHVQSEPGRGSRFTISIPWRQKEVALQEIIEAGGALPARVVPPKGVVPSRDVTVLLAEDNAANTLMISEYLESRGYQVVNAYDGLDAIEKAEAAGPHIILMDIQMPAMDGLEAIRRLRDNPRFVCTPIMALTALAMTGDRERCIQAGADEYMSKPVSLRMLAETIERMLQAGR